MVEDTDEEWIMLSCVDRKGNPGKKAIRIENISGRTALGVAGLFK